MSTPPEVHSSTDDLKAFALSSRGAPFTLHERSSLLRQYSTLIGAVAVIVIWTGAFAPSPLAANGPPRPPAPKPHPLPKPVVPIPHPLPKPPVPKPVVVKPPPKPHVPKPVAIPKPLAPRPHAITPPPKPVLPKPLPVMKPAVP